MTFNSDVISTIEKSVLCWLATVDAEGQPNVSPKEIWTHHESGTLLIANIASPRSVNNVKIQPKVCVSFIDILVQKGYKVYGKAEIVTTENGDYPALLAKLKPLAGERFTILNILKITATKVTPILAPSYMFYPDTSEAIQIGNAKQTYGLT